MKPATRVLDVESTLEGEKVGLSIDAGAMQHIMTILTDLYSDPELAVIREYSTNAFDAHVESSVERPIEVTTPSALSPFFKVRDYGEGLNAADIREIYSRYGASTKRNSNDVVGMLGLGCKSALTYTDQFTVVGWKNGICTQVVVSRDENGAGSMTILDQFSSDDPSGVEIVVPAKAHHEFEAKALSFFRFWKPGTVLVNGKSPDRIDGIWISDDMLLTTEVDQPFVVMGNVSYPMNGEIDSTSTRHYGWKNSAHYLVAFVDIGSVNFVPSREALMMNAQTKATIEAVNAKREKVQAIALTKLVQSAKTNHEAIELYFKCRSLGLEKDVKWNGKTIPQKFESVVIGQEKNYYGSMVDIHAPMVCVEANPRYRTKDWNVAYSIPSNTKTIWIVGYDSDKFTATKREKLEKWCVDNNITKPSYFTFTEKLPQNAEWIDKNSIYKWEDIKSVVLPKKETRADYSGRLTGSYDIYEGRMDVTKGVAANDIKTTDLFWAKGSVGRGSWGYTTRPDYLNELLTLHPNATVVILQQNRINKFMRDFPMAQEINGYLADQANKWEASVTARERTAYLLQHKSRDHAWLKKMTASKINDPKFKFLVQCANADIKPLVRLANMWNRLKKIDTTKIEEDLFKSYPLIEKMYLTNPSESDITHIELYVNAAYAAGKDK